MQIEEIEHFLAKSSAKHDYIKIAFRKRDSFYGIFLKGDDFTYLKSKNFWRIVPQSQLSAFNKSKDVNLARIFNGSEMTRLTWYKESFEG